jgi:hypothetical protein
MRNHQPWESRTDEHKRKQAPSGAARTIMKLAPMFAVCMLDSPERFFSSVRLLRVIG